LRSRYRIHRSIKLVPCGRHKHACQAPDHLPIELRPGRRAQELASFEVLHEITGSARSAPSTHVGKDDILLSTSFCYTSCYDIGHDISRLQDRENQLADLANTRYLAVSAFSARGSMTRCVDLLDLYPSLPALGPLPSLERSPSPDPTQSPRASSRPLQRPTTHPVLPQARSLPDPPRPRTSGRASRVAPSLDHHRLLEDQSSLGRPR
jgi:hypothetical protein